MTWPTVAVNTTNADASTDSPATFRTDVLDALTKLNQMVAHVSTFAATLLDDANAAAFRTTAGAAASGANSDITSLASLASVPAIVTSSVVNLTGAQTVAGVKTFSSGPVIPTQAPTDNSTSAASTAFVRSIAIGVDQTRQEYPTLSRALATTYTNTTGKPIFVNVSILQSSSTPVIQLTIGGKISSENTASVTGAVASACGVVMPGETYSCVTFAGGALRTWVEIR